MCTQSMYEADQMDGEILDELGAEHPYLMPSLVKVSQLFPDVAELVLALRRENRSIEASLKALLWQSRARGREIRAWSNADLQADDRDTVGIGHTDHAATLEARAAAHFPSQFPECEVLAHGRLRIGLQVRNLSFACFGFGAAGCAFMLDALPTEHPGRLFWFALASVSLGLLVSSAIRLMRLTRG